MSMDYEKAWKDHKQTVKKLLDIADVKSKGYNHQYIDGLKSAYVDVLGDMQYIEDHATYSEIEQDVANKIWEIAGISPEHGNAVQDIIGSDAYELITRIKTTNSFTADLVVVNKWMEDVRIGDATIGEAMGEAELSLENEKVWLAGSKTEDEINGHLQAIANIELYLKLLEATKNIK